MPRLNTSLATFTAILIVLAVCAIPRQPVRAAAPQSLRVATFNVSLYGQEAGELARRVSRPGDPQISAIAEIIQRVRPELLLLNEFDHDDEGAALRGFLENYLAVPQHASEHPDGPAEPIRYAYTFLAPSNTGIPSGRDLDNDGNVDDTPGDDTYARDALGFGRFPGQYGMAILSQHPIVDERVRTFRDFRWIAMPDARWPDDPATAAPADWYDAAERAAFRLSSKSHWDVPVNVRGTTIHLLASHPTPPVFDGPDDHNGCRNHDEIRFWSDYITPGEDGYIRDDAGNDGGVGEHAKFVILGDLNSDPADGDDDAVAINRLLTSPRIAAEPAPRSEGGVEQAKRQLAANQQHRTDPATDTADFPDDPGPGNLRLDYVLPSANVTVSAAGVFWPPSTDPLFALVGTYPYPSSDHRLVWVDLRLVD